MNIGEKIRKARADAGLTQEQVAEELNVSRQTISNWENEKTYPDIASVVLLSDVYGVSLDSLLKGEKPGYIEYLEESTNTVKSRRRLSEIITVSAYMLIWAISVLSFWIADEVDALGYSILVLWLIIPVVTVLTSVIIGARDYFGKGKWLLTLGFGIMYMLAHYSTFSLANMVSFSKVNMPEFSMMAVCIFISAAGMGIGEVIRLIAGWIGKRTGEKTKKAVKACVCILLVAAGVAGIYACYENNGCESTIAYNWNLQEFKEADLKEVYHRDSGESFHGDGIRYHVFEYDDNEYTDGMFDWKPAEDSASANTAEGWLDEIGVSQGQRPEYGNCTFWREKKDGNELIVFRSEAEKRLYVAEAFM